MSAGILVVCLSQDTPETSINTEYGEVRAGYELHFHLLDIARVDEAMHGPGHAKQTRNT